MSEMTVREAGRLGGVKTAKKYGRKHFTAMGEKGGNVTRERHGVEFYAEIGRKGGRSTAASKGPDFYKEIGTKGGARVKELCAAAKAAEAKTHKKTS